MVVCKGLWESSKEKRESLGILFHFSENLKMYMVACLCFSSFLCVPCIVSCVILVGRGLGREKRSGGMSASFFFIFISVLS